VTFRQGTLDTGHIDALVLGGSQGINFGSMGCEFQAFGLGGIQVGSVGHDDSQDALTIVTGMGCDWDASKS